MHRYITPLTAVALALVSGAALCGERHTFRDKAGKRDLVIEQGLSGNYIVRDGKGQRVGTGYKRQDGSIAIFDKDQKRIGTLSTTSRPPH